MPSSSPERPVDFRSLLQADLEDWRDHPVSKHLLRHIQEQCQWLQEEAIQASVQGVHHLASAHSGAAIAMRDLHTLCTAPRTPAPAPTTDTTFVDPANIKRKNGQQSI